MRLEPVDCGVEEEQFAVDVRECAEAVRAVTEERGGGDARGAGGDSGHQCVYEGVLVDVVWGDCRHVWGVGWGV